MIFLSLWFFFVHFISLFVLWMSIGGLLKIEHPKAFAAIKAFNISQHMIVSLEMYLCHFLRMNIEGLYKIGHTEFLTTIQVFNISTNLIINNAQIYDIQFEE